MRATLMWISVEVVIGVRIVQCHAIMNVVIGVRVMDYHAIIDVVIGVRVMLCHQAIDNSGFSTFLNFPLRIQILILSSSCINSSSLFPVAILFTLLHRENTSFEVWYLHIPKTQAFVENWIKDFCAYAHTHYRNFADCHPFIPVDPVRR